MRESDSFRDFLIRTGLIKSDDLIESSKNGYPENLDFSDDDSTSFDDENLSND